MILGVYCDRWSRALPQEASETGFKIIENPYLVAESQSPIALIHPQVPVKALTDTGVRGPALARASTLLVEYNHRLYVALS